MIIFRLGIFLEVLSSVLFSARLEEKRNIHAHLGRAFTFQDAQDYDGNDLKL